MYSRIPKPSNSKRRIRPKPRSAYDPSGSRIPAPIVQRGRRRSAPRTLMERVSDLPDVPRQIIGKKAFGIALERENRQVFKDLHDFYQDIYNRMLAEDVNRYNYVIDDILIPHPSQVVYDYRVNYNQVVHIILNQQPLIIAANNTLVSLDYKEFVLNVIAHAYFWTNLRSLDEIIDDGRTGLGFTFVNPVEFGSKTRILVDTFETEFSFVPIVHIRDKPISGTMVTLIYPVTNPPMRFIVHTPFRGILQELVQLVIDTSIQQFHMNPAEAEMILLNIGRDRSNGGLEVELFLG